MRRPHEHRQAERQRLARTGLGLSANIPARETVLDGQSLYGKWAPDALAFQRLHQLRRHAEIRECDPDLRIRCHVLPRCRSQGYRRKSHVTFIVIGAIMFDMTTLAEGDLAPAFSLPDQDGSPVSLGDFAGRRVVVYFYPADDTPGCTKEACQFSDLVDDYAALGVQVIGISPDGGTKHQKFRAKYGLKIALLSDTDHKVMEPYGAFGPKTLYGRKRSEERRGGT